MADESRDGGAGAADASTARGAGAADGATARGAGAGDPRSVERTVRIAAPPEVVFGFLTDRQLLARWMGFAAELDPRPGGRFRCSVIRRDLFVRGEFVEVDPPRRVVLTWGWEGVGAEDLVPPGSTTVEFTLRPEAGETVLTLRHQGLPAGHDVFHATGWDHFLARLAAAAAGRDPEPVRRDAMRAAGARLRGASDPEQ